MLRGALIGFGSVAERAHLPMWEASGFGRIEAVAEPAAERAALAERLLPGARIYPDAGTLLARECPDFVDICTPSGCHAGLLLAACRAGLNVFCEKPLVTDPGQLSALAGGAGGRPVIFTVNNWKYAPIWRRALALLHARRIGAVQSVSLSVLRPPASGGGASDWRHCAEAAGGGILLDHGWHHFYLLQAILPAAPLAVAARMEFDDCGLEETVDLALRYPGAEARLYLTWRAARRQNFGTIIGRRGSLWCNDDHLVLAAEGESAVRFDFPEALSAGSQHPAWMRPVAAHFRRELQDFRVCGANFREAWWCARLTALAYRSAREGSRWVGVDEPAAAP